MGTKYYIKNMVCDRCNSTVNQIFTEAGYQIHHLELGLVEVKQDLPTSYPKLESTLISHGFEIIQDEQRLLIEQLKIELLKKINSHDSANLSQTLAKTFHQSYSNLSKIFSKSEGITIEKYTIELKIEKVKELIQLGELNFSEIAYALNYNSSSHLASQFKSITGLSMSDYKSHKNWNRKTLDQIV